MSVEVMEDLTVDEYASHAKLSRSAVYRLLKLGMPSKKFLKFRRINVVEADAWINAGGADATRRRQTKAKRV